MDYINATILILGTAPMSHSHHHDEPRLEGESPEAYDRRTWRSKMNTEVVNGVEMMMIPAAALAGAIQEAAKYLNKRIPGQGTATWTAKFRSGVALMSNGVTDVRADDVRPIMIYANLDGVRGSGKRGSRWLPQTPAGWRATFQVAILDPIITQDIFQEVLEGAGLFIGVGQHRPGKGGGNGRFVIEKIEWQDNRRPIPPRTIMKRAA